MASCAFMVKRKKSDSVYNHKVYFIITFSLSDSVVLDMHTLLLGRAHTDLCPDTVETVVSEFDELCKE